MALTSSDFAIRTVSPLDPKTANYSLINPLLSDQAWGSIFGFVLGNRVSLTYSFPWDGGGNAFFTGYNGRDYSPNNYEKASYRTGFNSIQQSAAADALQTWADVANLSFSRVVDNSTTVGDIRFAFSSAPYLDPWWGAASYPNASHPVGGDIWVNYKYASSKEWQKGSSNFDSLIHEIGHALGLKHPFEDGPVLSRQYDSSQYTVMSYTEPEKNLWVNVSTNGSGYEASSRFVNAETPMVLDVAAIQYMYGKNKTYRSGDDTYRLDPVTPFLKTIWDSGGIDTIDGSSFTRSCKINLMPGSYSSFGFYSNWFDFKHLNWTDPYKDAEIYDGTNNLGIAFDCFIENAYGGSGSDTLTGNDLNNQLKGNFGNDALYGGGGVDTALFSFSRASYTLQKTSAVTWNISDKIGSREGSDSLYNIERLKFSDVSIALDFDGAGGQAFRIYKAAFNRDPTSGDQKGLGYWINQMDRGMGMVEVSSRFIDSAEFRNSYGFNPTNSQFLTKVYQNVLGRQPEASGFNWWLNELNTNPTKTKAKVLADFAESAENQTGVLGLIGNGITYEPWVG